MKGYKVFKPDWTCRDFQYEVGKTYKHEGDIEPCKAGFHFCQKLVDCFQYYAFNTENKIAEVEAIGLIKTDGNKSVTDEIKIVREITWVEASSIVNKGYNNIGTSNKGNCNVGHRNVGDHNTGSYNVGFYNVSSDNVGHRNSGSCNIGNANTGHCNIGNYNVGRYNIGDFNTGNWNKTNCSSGFFNTMEQPIYAFNKKLNISREEFRECEGVKLLETIFGPPMIWVTETEMTEEEKQTHPSYAIAGGYLKTEDFKASCKFFWDEWHKFNDEKHDIQVIKEIPNFDADIFEEITGIRI